MEFSPDVYHLDKRQVMRAFNRAALSYGQQAVLQQTVLERLLEHLDPIKISPQWILDAGAGTGHGSRLLCKRYKSAKLLLLDLAQNMLAEARRQAPRFFSPERYLQADLENLPLATASIDMIFSNLALQWCNDLDQTFQECRRILKTNGLIIFSTFGPDTLKELRSSWSEADTHPHVHTFIDMHDIGDALIRAGFSSPVMEAERLTLTYTDLRGLLEDLKNIGATNATISRRQGLTARGALARLEQRYEHFRRDGRLPATYEIIYGHAWVPERGARPQDGSTVATFPLNQLRRR